MIGDTLSGAGIHVYAEDFILAEQVKMDL